MGVGGQGCAPATLTLGKRLIVQEAAWAPRPVWTDVENVDTTGIQFPDSPARSKSL